MPPSRNNPGPRPPVMTWGKALPALAVSALFDLLRLIFEWFIFFGPALLGTAAGLATSSALDWLPGNAGAWTAGVVGAAAAGVSGVFGVEVFEAVGAVMAIIMGLLGWATVMLWLTVGNHRIFKANTSSLVHTLLGFIISEVPFLGSLPVITFTVYRWHAAEIRQDKAALRQWEQAQQAAQLAQRAQQQQAAQLIYAAQIAQAANDNEAALEEEIPEEEPRAA